MFFEHRPGRGRARGRAKNTKMTVLDLGGRGAKKTRRGEARPEKDTKNDTKKAPKWLPPGAPGKPCTDPGAAGPPREPP